MADSNIIEISSFTAKDKPKPLDQFLNTVKLCADEALKQALFEAVEEQKDVRDRFSSASHELTDKSIKLTLAQLHEFMSSNSFNNLKTLFTEENRGATFELNISAPNISLTEKDIMGNIDSKANTCAIPTRTDVLVHIYAYFSLPEEEEKFG